MEPPIEVCVNRDLNEFQVLLPEGLLEYKLRRDNGQVKGATPSYLGTTMNGIYVPSLDISRKQLTHPEHTIQVPSILVSEVLNSAFGASSLEIVKVMERVKQIVTEFSFSQGGGYEFQDLFEALRPIVEATEPFRSNIQILHDKHIAPLYR
jgi:hypothetical protein